MDTNQNFASAKYLIYSCWETKSQSGCNICSSNYYQVYPQNEQEAIEILEQIKKNADEFNKKFPNPNTIRRYGYHLNQPEWWSR